MQCFIYFVFFVFDTIATYRYMTLSPDAKLQQQSNKEKFELARKLKYSNFRKYAHPSFLP